MSNNDNTKLFFDEQLNLELLEGGVSSIDEDEKKSYKRLPQPSMSEKDRAPFIRKTFGLFTVMILFQMIYIIGITKDTKGDLTNFAKNQNTMWTGIWMTLIPVIFMVYKKRRYKPVHVVLGYLCWFIYTAGLVLLAGNLAVRNGDPTKILIIQISTMVTCLGIMCLGGRLVPQGNVSWLSSLGPSFAVLTLICTSTAITCICLDIGKVDGSTTNMVITMMFVFLFFIMDIKFIVTGRYNTFTVEDSLLGSMKLFADFILVFGELSTICG